MRLRTVGAATGNSQIQQGASDQIVQTIDECIIEFGTHSAASGVLILTKN